MVSFSLPPRDRLHDKTHLICMCVQFDFAIFCCIAAVGCFLLLLVVFSPFSECVLVRFFLLDRFFLFAETCTLQYSFIYACNLLSPSLFFHLFILWVFFYAHSLTHPHTRNTSPQSVCSLYVRESNELWYWFPFSMLK